MEKRIAPVMGRVTPVTKRIAPVTRRFVAPATQRVKERIAPVTRRAARVRTRIITGVKKRLLRLKWIAWSQQRVRRATAAVTSAPGVEAPAILAAVTIALAAWPSPGLLVGALVLWQSIRALQIARKRPLGAMQTTAATIATVACALGLRGQGAATVWVALLAGVAVVVALVQGPLQQRVRPRIRAVNLPGVPTDRRAQEPGALGTVVPGIGLVLALLLVAESVWDLPAYVGGLGLVVALGWLGRCGLRLQAITRARADGSADAEVAAALERYAPQFYLYFSGPVAGDYQLKMWLPYLEQLGVPFAILARSAQMLPRAARLNTSAPLISCPAVTGLDICMVPSVRAVFYVNINGSIADGVRYIDRTHVHLNHGDSDKPASYHPIFAMFDRDFVAGPAAVDRFARHGVFMPQEKFVVVGRPQVAAITEANTHPLPDRRTVLYAPTWQSGMREMSLSSLEHGERIVRTLLDAGVRVIFRPHPLSAGQSDAAATIARINAMLVSARTPQCPHLTSSQASKKDIIDNINRSDAMVTDVSSVVSDYLASCKPMAVVLPTGTQALADADEYPVLRATYLIDLAADDLAGGLAPLVGAAADALEATRHELRSYYLSDHEDSVQAFLDAATAVLRDPSEPAAAAG